MPTFISRGVLVLTLTATGGPVAAQAITGAPGSAGGLFGGHHPVTPTATSQRLWTNFDLSTGLDTGSQSGLLSTTTAETHKQFADTAGAAIGYWRGKNTRYFDVSANSFMNRQEIAPTELYGGRAQVGGGLNTGRTLRLNASASVALDGAAVSAITAPPAGATSEDLVRRSTYVGGVLDDRWRTTTGTAGAGFTWSRQQSTTASGWLSASVPVRGSGLDSEARGLTLQHLWNLDRSQGLTFGYRFSGNRQHRAEDLGLGLESHVRSHAVDVGWRSERHLSSIRTVTLWVAGGMTFTTEEALGGTAPTYSAPVYSGGTALSLTRVWFFSAEARREVSVVAGVSPVPFTSDSGNVRLDWVPSPRMRLALAGLFTVGHGADESRPDTFRSSNALAQFQYGLARCCGIFTTYNFYRHRLVDVPVPIGFPASYDRQAIRIGFSLWLPLYGSF